MQWLLSSILRYKNLFLYFFFVTLILSFSYYQSEYHKSKIFKASIFISGKTSEPLKKLGSYFKLKKMNGMLVWRVPCKCIYLLTRTDDENTD